MRFEFEPMRLTVLSPHRDDAIFSLALALKKWTLAGVRITVLDFFTRSDYAPYAFQTTDISALRANEDRRSARAIDRRIEIRSLSLLDAPIRLPIDFGSIMNPDAFTPQLEEVIRLGRNIRNICRRTLVLAPLGLGDHIDHRTVHQAAMAAGLGKGLGFYEDLPYAISTPEAAIRASVSNSELRLGMPLIPLLQGTLGWRFKERVVRKYQSQVDDQMIRSIARYGEKYRNAERIWIPSHSARWQALRSQHMC